MEFHNPEEGKSLSAEAIQAWLVSRLAMLLELHPQDIDVQEPLTHYGIDSIEAVTISGELSDWIGHDLSPTLVWDFPTIAAIAQYLVTISK